MCYFVKKKAIKSRTCDGPTPGELNGICRHTS